MREEIEQSNTEKSIKKESRKKRKYVKSELLESLEENDKKN